MSKVVQLQAKLDNKFYLQNDSKNEIYLYLELKAIHWEAKKERLPLNVSLVLDRSGSMSGEKLEYVKKATQFVIQNLNKNDYLSIVQYDNQVDVVSPSALISNKNELSRKVSMIRAGGSTNLSGGTLEGYAQVAQTKKAGYVNRVLMLSDGLANVGITDPERLQEMAGKHFREKGIGLSTFGVGAGFNELLMTGMAEHGGANYYFIESPDEIPQIFSQELQGLLSVVAQNTKLKITFPSAYVSCEKAYGYLHETAGETVTINFNDVFSDEEKAVLLKFKLRQPLTRNLDFKVELEYDDAVVELGKVREESNLSLQLTQNAEDCKTGLDIQAAENIALFVAGEDFDKAMLMVDRGDFSQAKTSLNSIVTYLETHIRLIPGSERLRQLLERVQNYLKQIPNLEQMRKSDSMGYSMAQKASRSANYAMKKRKF